MKACFKCGVEKSLDEYYRHPAMPDGRLNKCKECTKKDVRENSRRNADYYREYDKWRYRNDPNVKKRHLRYAKTEKGRAAAAAAKARYVERNTIKRGAHIIVGNAIRDGVIERNPCEVCGAKKVHAHHDDYAKPLKVRWLCPNHHQEWHDKHGEGKNAR